MSLFKCKDGTYILKVLVCDQIYNCPDRSDEQICPRICNYPKKDCWVSQSRMCVPPDCICVAGHFQCRSGGCVPYDRVCDEKADCEDLSDEEKCSFNEITMRYATYNSAKKLPKPCPHGYSSCGRRDAHCFRNDMVCVHHFHLLYRSSESCVSSLHLYNCTHHECPHQYKCANAFCIPTHFVCDGITDCPEGEDEEDCEKLSCPGLLKCSHDNLCVHPHYINDGNVQCVLSQDDEGIIDLVNLPQCSNAGFSVQCIKVNVTLQNILDLSSKLKFLLLLSVTLEYNDTMFQHFDNLYLLDLTSSPLPIVLTSKLFQGLTTLHVLILKNVSIMYINSSAFVDLELLHLLDIQNNHLKVIIPLTFNGIRTLDHLDLSMLQIKQLHTCTFCVMDAVDYLDISMNSLTILRAYVFSGVSINKLNITGT